MGNAYISTTLVLGGSLTCPNIHTKSEVDALVATAPTIADGSLTISMTDGLQTKLDDMYAIQLSTQASLGNTSQALVYVQQDLTALTSVVDTKATQADLPNGLLTRATVSSLVAGLATKQDKLNSFSSVSVGTLTSGVTTIFVNSTTGQPAVTTAEVGSGVSFCRFTDGHHLDAYSRSNNAGRQLYFNYYANSTARIGQTGGRLGINCDPSSAYHIDVVGSGRFTGPLVASNFPSTSNARIKESVVDASLDECTRLVHAVVPKPYTRKDMDDAPRLGYIAQDFDRELTGGYRCIMGASEDENGPLLALDYSRFVPVLHGALLSVLARIEALESRI